MKSFITGFVTIFALAIIGLIAFKPTTSFMEKMFGSPTPTPSASASYNPIHTSAPSATPSPSPDIEDISTPTPTPKPAVKGVSTTNTTKKTVVTTTSNLLLTLVKSSVCPISYTTEVKDIKGPLSLRYKLIKDTSFGITVWNSKGEELLSNTIYSGDSGLIKTFSGLDYLKVRVESKTCAGNNDNWLTLTAER